MSDTGQDLPLRGAVTRRSRVAMASAHPHQAEFALAYARLTAAAVA
jgi:hypothetical protein